MQPRNTRPRDFTFPALRYTDARAAIDWLVSAFGFERQTEFAAPNGAIAHAELRLGAGVIGLNSAGPANPANPWTTVPQCHSATVPQCGRASTSAWPRWTRVTPRRWLRVRQSRARCRTPTTVRASTRCATATASCGAWAPTAWGHAWPAHLVGLCSAQPRAQNDWLSRAFGFAPGLEVLASDGSLAHGELRVGTGGLVMVAGGEDEIWGHNTRALYVYLEDPDRHHAQAHAAGATIVRPPADTPDGTRGYLARDPERFLWGFSTYQPLTTR